MRKIVTIVTILAIFLLLQFAIQGINGEYTSTQNMKNYAQTVIDVVNQEVNTYFPSSKGSFTFYSNVPYSVKFYSSTQYGAALSFEPSSTPSFEIVNSSKRIELAVFGGNWNETALLGGDYITDFMLSGQTLTNWGGPLLRLGNNSNGIVKNETINGVFYNLVIIKSSNDSSAWTPELAINDVKAIMNSDVEGSFVNSEAINSQIVARYSADTVLLNRARYIQSQLLYNKSDYAPTQFFEDYKQLEDMARNQYHLPDPEGYLNELFKFVNAQLTGILPTYPLQPTPTPSPSPTPVPTIKILMVTIDDPTNWIWVLCIVVFSLVDIKLLMITIDTKNKHTSTFVKILFGAFTVSIGVIILDLAHQPPSNYQLISFQSALLGSFASIVIAFGIVSFYNNKKESGNMFVAKNKGKKQSKQKPNKKTKESVSTKEAKIDTNQRD